MTQKQFIALMPYISSDLVAAELFRPYGVFDALNEFYDIDIYLKSRNAVMTA